MEIAKISQFVVLNIKIIGICMFFVVMALVSCENENKKKEKSKKQ